MSVSRFALLIMVAPLMTGAALNAQAAVHASSVRLERCDRLHVQLDATLEAKHAAGRVDTAKALGARASKLCASHKEALGARTYVKALSLMGVKHVDVN